MNLSVQRPYDGRLLLRVQEAAAALAVGRNTLLGLIERGELPTVRIGRSVRIRVSDLESWVKQYATDTTK